MSINVFFINIYCNYFVSIFVEIIFFNSDINVAFFYTQLILTRKTFGQDFFLISTMITNLSINQL